MRESNGITGGTVMEQPIYLWLDDVRPAPSSKFLLVKTARQAIDALKTGRVVFASLDHDILWFDLDDDPILEVPPDWADTLTGYAVVAWMEKNNVWPPEGVAVHSSNRDGRKRMIEIIERCGLLVQ